MSFKLISVVKYFIKGALKAFFLNKFSFKVLVENDYFSGKKFNAVVFCKRTTSKCDFTVVTNSYNGNGDQKVEFLFPRIITLK